MNRQIILFACAACFLSACSFYRVDSDETSFDYFPSKSSAKDIVYLEKVDQPFEVLGVVTINTERRTEKPELIAKIRREAALIGGDAVTNIQERPSKLKGHLKNAYWRTTYTADVIKLKAATLGAETPTKP